MDEVETQLADVGDRSLDEVADDRRLDGYREVLLAQVERPRFNIGNTGPPGRAD